MTNEIPIGNDETKFVREDSPPPFIGMLRRWAWAIRSSFVIRHSSFLLLLSSAPLLAEPLKVSLVSEVTRIQPGKPFSVGLHLQHAEHYHTYWKFPGIVGVPTDIAWKLPAGWKAGPIEWPEPERVMMFKIKAQGFHGEVLLPITLTPPPDLPVDRSVTLAGKATWMCCGQECNPGFADLDLTLPVAAAPGTPDPQWRERFAKARAQVAQPAAGWEIKASRKDSLVTLRMVAQSDAAKARAERLQEAIFFTEDGFINADKPQTLAKENPHTVVMTLEVSQYFPDKTPPAALLGLVQATNGWGDGSASKSIVICAPIEHEKP